MYTLLIKDEDHTLLIKEEDVYPYNSRGRCIPF